MENEIKISVENGVKELVIRHGRAADIPQPRQRGIIGQLDSVLLYAMHQQPDPKKAHILLNREEMTALLFVDATDPLAALVEGRMEVNPDLQKFNINGGTCTPKLRREEMRSFLRQNRFFFPDKDAHAELVSSISNFSAKVGMSVQQAADSRGNKINNFAKEVEADVPFDAVIEMPVFKGGEKKRLAVEICFDVTEGGSLFWIESAELDEILRAEIDAAFDRLKDELVAVGYLVFEK